MEFTEEENARFSAIIEERVDRGDGVLVYPFVDRDVFGGYKWIMENKLDGDNDRWVLEYHLDNGEYEVAEWLVKSGYPMSEDIMLDLVDSGDLEGAQWLKDHGCPWNKKALMKVGPHSDDEDMIEWVKSLPV